MNARHPLSDRHVEELVRTYLERQEAGVDAARILAGVHARSAAGTGDRSPLRGSRFTFRRGGWRLAVAAALLFAVTWSLQLAPSRAGATQLVEEARKVHATPVDRCYQVEMQIEPAPEILESVQMLPLPRPARLWTRGDRFWMELPHPHRPSGAWGRDEEGRVWFASPARTHGIRFEPHEVPEGLAVACELRSMQVETLLHKLLTDFDLEEIRPTTGQNRGRRVVVATPRPAPRLRPLRAVRLEMDAASKVLQRVVLDRVHADGARSTVTFTLQATGSQPDAHYRLEGHLNSEAVIHGPDEVPAQRLRVLRKQFGGFRP